MATKSLPDDRRVLGQLFRRSREYIDCVEPILLRVDYTLTASRRDRASARRAARKREVLRGALASHAARAAVLLKYVDAQGMPRTRQADARVAFSGELIKEIEGVIGRGAVLEE